MESSPAGYRESPWSRGGLANIAVGSGKIPRNPLAHLTEELQVPLGTGDFREAESMGQTV